MTPKLKARWVKALRSGRYMQVQGRAGTMIDGKEHNCCLGVLARTAHLSTYNTFGEKVERLNNTCNHPLSSEVLHPDRQRSLANMNDTGVSFAEIADAIEKDTKI